MASSIKETRKKTFKLQTEVEIMAPSTNRVEVVGDDDDWSVSKGRRVISRDNLPMVEQLLAGGQRRGSSAPPGGQGSQQPLVWGGVGDQRESQRGLRNPLTERPHQHEEDSHHDDYLALGARPKEDIVCLLRGKGEMSASAVTSFSSPNQDL